MKLAEFEAETICNLEKENFKLSDALNLAEENFEREREKNKNLENEFKVSLNHQLMIVNLNFQKSKVMQELAEADEMKKQTKSNQELIDLQQQLLAANKIISELQKENVELKVQV